eukprot:GILJ01031410.1.p1 GENE.GILJ01031410.1~~GILJ01031410.1.p1  ORF type:complete len:182 (-),score=20.04 GILJ01031410.1:40-585(-)
MFRQSQLNRLVFAQTRFLFCASAAPNATHPYGKSLLVSPRCFDNIRRINKNEDVANQTRFLRLAIESGGCQGFSYKFYFDDEVDPEEDIKFEISNATAPGMEGSNQQNTSANIPSSARPAASSSAADPTDPFVVADKTTLTKMQGAIIDYHTELKGSAFVVIGNEFVDHSCACAQSFSLRK